MSYFSKIIIVTGAGKGIGRCIAKTYAAEGAKVIVAEKKESAGTRTAAEIKSAGHEALFVKCDVSKPEDIIQLVDITIEKYRQIDIVINNAGVSRWKSPYELSVDEWDEILNTNLRSMFLLSREAALHMKGRGGSIVNIASTRAFMSEPDTEAYAASKGGIVALTHALAASFAADNIQVNCISPGWIETGDYLKLRETDHKQHFAQRVGKPEDIARACLFLTAPENNFVSGINLTIDGGMTHKMIYEPD
ncbi:MAG: glucose 1-dehydrogenase [Bacteroidales bacterium]|nr:glucose 1-dehydrogenase [Bacteroidales bacterium]